MLYTILYYMNFVDNHRILQACRKVSSLKKKIYIIKKKNNCIQRVLKTKRLCLNWRGKALQLLDSGRGGCPIPHEEKSWEQSKVFFLCVPCLKKLRDWKETVLASGPDLWPSMWPLTSEELSDLHLFQWDRGQVFGLPGIVHISNKKKGPKLAKFAFWVSPAFVTKVDFLMQTE